MVHNISYDICALCVCLILFFSTFFRRVKKDKTSRYVLTLITTTFICTIFDILSVMPSLGVVTAWITNTGYLLTRNYTTLLFLIYVYFLTDTWHLVKKKLWLKLVTFVPYFLIVVLLIVNLFTGCVFSITPDAVYVREAYIYVLYVLSAITLFFAFFYLLYYRKLVRAYKIVAAGSILPLTIFSIVLQFHNKYLLIELFATSIAILFATVTMERPEEIMDNQTGLEKRNIFEDTLKRNFITNKNYSILFLKIKNYSFLVSTLHSNDIRDVLKMISFNLYKQTQDFKINARFFTLERGNYAIMFDDIDSSFLEVFAMEVRNSLTDKHMFRQIGYSIEPQLVIARIPDDFKSYNQLLEFSENYYKFNKFDEEIVSVNTLKYNKNFNMINYINTIIDNAIKEDKFQLYYQPIYSTKEKKFKTCEALLRLFDDEFGFVPPDIIIDAAERNGSINMIGEIVLRKVCEFIASKEFKSMGLDYVEVNISTIQLTYSKFADTVERIVKEANIDFNKLNFEITETASDAVTKNVMSNINKLKSLGISFSLDDYGTGYSNIMKIITLPINIIKLDRTFVNADTSKKNSVLNNTITMIKDLDLEIVVEGIEDDEMAQYIIDCECEYIQGYYYSKPIPKNDLISFINEKNA